MSLNGSQYASCSQCESAFLACLGWLGKAGVGRGTGLERWLARSAAEHQASPLSESMVVTCLFFF